MKKSLLFILSGLVCSVSMADNKSLTQKMLQPVISHQCEQELKQSKLWQTSTYFMQTAQRIGLQQKVCGCVGENALNDVKGSTFAKAMLNDAEKDKLIQKAVLNSLQACVKEVF